MGPSYPSLSVIMTSKKPTECSDWPFGCEKREEEEHLGLDSRKHSPSKKINEISQPVKRPERTNPVAMEYNTRRLNPFRPPGKINAPDSRSVSVANRDNSINAADMLRELRDMSTKVLLVFKYRVDSLLEERATDVDAMVDELDGWDVLVDDVDLTASEAQYDFVEDAGIVKQYEN